MGELREIPFESEYVPDTMGHLLKLKAEGHDALAVYFPSKEGWDVTCSCPDPTTQTGHARWFVNGVSDKPVLERFQSHLSYATRPKTKPD